ncbi:hypothetical protein JAAARDRAFT_42167 [Jaapia argillacea MUCL 33604]|uniref:G-patch domain-containing protein n=1 Tax=Jaapia argillacea MUCL 33604 TaxID=933084 RepID=A0A067PIT9_9AGAM|nr:hypothetical protein JAAARDRAFT_42167 [Jaapia argillacea MUCL 33604]
MNFSGTGSINSPIVISDDDDNEPDICFIEPPPTLYLPPGPPTPVIPANSQQQTAGRKTVPPILSDNVGYSMLLGMGYVPGMGLGVALDGMFYLVT